MSGVWVCPPVVLRYRGRRCWVASDWQFREALLLRDSFSGVPLGLAEKHAPIGEPAQEPRPSNDEYIVSVAP